MTTERKKLTFGGIALIQTAVAAAAGGVLWLLFTFGDEGVRDACLRFVSHFLR